MQYARRFFTYIFCLALFSSANVFAQQDDDFSGEVLSSILDIRDEDRYLVYGDYAEVEINATEAVDLQFYSEVVPYGMELEKVSETSYVLFGRAEFLGKLCFLIDAKKVRTGEFTAERLCLYAEENEELNYPIILSERFLDPVKENEYASFDIEIFNGKYPMEVDVLGQLPGNLAHARTSANGDNDVLNISGTVSSEGVYEFIVKAIDNETQVISYKQFVLEVTPQDRGYACGPGYYYDEYLARCVQTGGSECGFGTFYDISSGTCVAYRTNICRAGQYFDHWQNRCVFMNSYRCPINYEWDGFYNRCVRLPYTCSIGQRYDYRMGMCISLYRHRVCPVGSHWSTYKQRCVGYANYCHSGYYWQGSRCISSPRSCRVGSYFDPYSRRCVAVHVNRSCGPRSVWNHQGGRCVTRTIYQNRTCRAGTRWSGPAGRCIGHVDRRVVRHPSRPHRPGPVMRPTTRPTPRPNRPTTRPTPRPNRPTTRPTPPPSRPTTRPTPPPSRPTTRPTPPPSRPTTRPTPPPSRPTTRPTPPPSRPTTRPTPPPSRPTTRPTPPPSRPTTRPTPPPRPSRPSTSPSRPSRPSGPSTSPSRPSRPSGGSSGGGSRPSRPNRPNGRG